MPVYSMYHYLFKSTVNMKLIIEASWCFIIKVCKGLTFLADCRAESHISDHIQYTCVRIFSLNYPMREQNEQLPMSALDLGHSCPQVLAAQLLQALSDHCACCLHAISTKKATSTTLPTRYSKREREPKKKGTSSMTSFICLWRVPVCINGSSCTLDLFKDMNHEGGGSLWISQRS